MRQQAKLSLSSQVRCKGNTVADTQPIRLEITTADKGRGRRICPGSAMRLSPGSGSNGIPCIHVNLKNRIRNLQPEAFGYGFRI